MHLGENDRAALQKIVESGDIPIFLPSMAADLVDVLRRLTKRRAICFAAEKIALGEGGELSDGLLDWLLHADVT
jgi:hypothetical protein